MKNTTSWIASAVVAAATTAIAFVYQVKQSALRKLSGEGAFNAIEQDRLRSVNQITHEHSFAQPDLLHHKEDKELKETEKTWREKVKLIAQQRHVDTFSGAWNSLSGNVQAKCLAFAAVGGVVMGGVARIVTKPGRGRGGDSTDGVDAGDSFFGFGSHHDGGHHDFGGFMDGGFDLF